MKRNLLLWISALFLTAQAVAQTAEIPTSEPRLDYSPFNFYGKEQNRNLHNAFISGKSFIAVQTEVTIRSDQAGGFSFSKNIYISGVWGVSPLRKLEIGGEVWKPNKTYRYPKDSQGLSIICTLYFDRIPAGVSSINYCEPGFTWKNIPIDNNPDTPHTKWTQTLLKEQWKANGYSTIEGIYDYYEFIPTNADKKWWGTGKHTFAILKNENEYELIYLNGSNPGVWREGDIKAYLAPTAVPGLYKATTWFTENKAEDDDFYIRYDDQWLYIYKKGNESHALFLKLFPTNETSQAYNKKAGSGIVLNRQGIVATNYHVIEGAEAIDVSIKNNNQIGTYKATVLCTDKANDLALLQIKDPSADTFPAIPYAIPSKTFDVGTSVFAMGYPMSNLMGSEVKITDGIINSKTGYQGDVVTYQISAPIQPGNSGGPLFDKKGNLVGITNAGILAANNVGYAIKAIYLRNLIESAPIRIEIPETSELDGMELPDQIKSLSNFVALIKVR